jgi:hypothetical protein
MDVFKTLLLDTPDSLNAITGTLQIANGGTGATDAAGARDNLLPDYTGNVGKVLTVNSGATDVEWTTNGAGTVTSVDVSGGTTGLTTSGGPVTSSGTITLAGTLAVANGGTGITSLGSGVATFLGTPSSANLAAAVTDETGTGALVFASSPTLVTPALGAATATSINGVTVTGTSTPALSVTGTTAVSGTNTGDQTTITGNAGTATILETARNINGVSFNGSADITVTAAAGTLTGATLAAGVTASSLTSLGTIASLTATALTVNDNTTLGSSNTDTVTFTARVASDINPATDDTYDLGVTGHEWRNLNIDGTANIDSLVADTADINGGTIDGTSIGATTPSTGAFTDLSANTLSGLPHTVQVFTTGSGTYTTPAGVKAIWVRLVGGGGGGGASATNAGTTGGNTTFSTLTGSGGVGAGAGWTAGGAGGSASGGDLNISGGGGGSGSPNGGSSGSTGGNSAFGGGAKAAQPNSAGYAAAANSGGGGSGGNDSAFTNYSGPGGGAGGYCEKLFHSPAATYSYAVGSGGAGGAAGGQAGGNGGSGVIIVTEYYS